MPESLRHLFQVVLVEPQIPSNSGAIIRLCANTGCRLHLIHPIAFELDDKKFRRAGLDYHEYAQLHCWNNLDECLDYCQPSSINLFSTKARKLYQQANFQTNSLLVFGSETKGLAQAIFDQHGMDSFYRLPMKPKSRSMNLANAVSVVVYEGWRQLNFIGSD